MTRALDVVPGGVVSLTADLRIISTNPAMAELVGREPSEIVARPFDLLLTAPSRILFQTHVFPALAADGRVEEVFLTLAARDGNTTPVLLNAVRTSPDAGPADAADAPRPAYQALVVRIHARARWETELLAATRALEAERAASQQLAEELAEAARALAGRHAEERRQRAFRDAFIGVVSHELRTPITTIFGMSHILRGAYRSMDPDALGRNLDDIAAEAERLRRLTEDLLVLSRAEGGRLALSSDPILVGHVASRATRNEAARDRDREIVAKIPPTLPLVLGDELYVEQIIGNLLGNAAKYSPPRSPIRVEVTSEDGGVAVRVTDRGPGIGGEDPEQLFELYYRARQAITRTSGAGIGLFVCRELVHAMHGRIWAIDRPQSLQGAEFGFWLPAAEYDEIDDAADEVGPELPMAGDRHTPTSG